MKLRTAHCAAIAMTFWCVVLVSDVCADGSSPDTSLAVVSSNAVLRVEARVDRTNCTVADRVVLEYIVDSPIDGVLTLPKLDASADSLWKGWRVARSLSREQFIPSETGTPRKRTTMHVVLEPFLPGSKNVPEQRFVFSPNVGGNAVETSSKAIDVLVTSVIPDTDTSGSNTPRPKGLRTLTLETTASDRLRTAYIAVGSAIGASLLTLGIVRVLRRPRPAADPIHDAITKLERLRDQGGSLSEVASTLRMAIAARGVPLAPNLTPDELIPVIGASPWFLGQMQRDLLPLISELARDSYAPGSKGSTLIRTYAERALTAARALQQLPREGE